jgi:hypothetical protein
MTIADLLCRGMLILFTYVTYSLDLTSHARSVFCMPY